MKKGGMTKTEGKAKGEAKMDEQYEKVRVKDPDKSPALLERGKVFVSKDILQKYGKDLLRQINGGDCDIVEISDD